ncbi:hypothetical protein ACP5PY_12645 [Photobacterium leiognathi subsp. mandapamensis]
MKSETVIELQCVFCDSFLESTLDYEPSSGDTIECQNCHQPNDYNLRVDAAVNKEVDSLIEDYLDI